MQQLVEKLKREIGVDETQTHINMAIMMRREFGAIAMRDYVRANVEQLTAVEREIFADSIADLDPAIVSVELD